MPKLTDDWLFAEETQAALGFLTAAGHQALVVGGCVRNALLGVPVADIDVSTDARPERVSALANSAGHKAIPTGIEHGTVTVVINEHPFEVTTFRQDVETDGRRAVVAFSDNIDDDARRRDFTMNALYAGADGSVVDPLGGLEDLRARRIRFIEDPSARIREDYLRSLRFFRFHAWYGAPGFDPEAMDAIARNVDGLATLSAERVGAEVMKLLSADDPAPAVAGMRSTGVLAQLMPGADDAALGPLVHLESGVDVPPKAQRRLAVLGGENLTEWLRLSRKDADYIDRVRRAMDVGMPPAALGYIFGEDIARDVVLVQAALFSTPIDGDSLAKTSFGAAQTFPVHAADLMPDLEGKALGDQLQALEKAWIDSDFTLSRETLLKMHNNGDDS